MKILVASIIALMAFGSYVRAMNAGLTCPDWPLCYGKFIPEYHFGVYLEFIHRAYAGLETVLFVLCLFTILRSKSISREAKRMSLVALALLLGQIVMGGLTVLLLLKSVIVTSHLALAALFMAAILWTTMLLQKRGEPEQVASSRVFRPLMRALPIVVFAQLLLGGLVASTYAGLVCLDFPKCNGLWVPTFVGPIGLQVRHRFGAYFVAFLIFVLRMIAPQFHSKRVLRMTQGLMVLVVLQICLGILNLKFYLPAWGAVLHHFTGVLLFAFSVRNAFVSKYELKFVASPTPEKSSRPFDPEPSLSLQ